MKRRRRAGQAGMMVTPGGANEIEPAQARQRSIPPLLGQPRGSARLDRGVADILEAAHPDRRAIAGRPMPARRRVEFAEQRVVDHPDLGPALPHEGDRDAETRDAAQKIGRAVDRVDDPDAVADLAAALLAEEGVAWKRLAEAPADQFLDLGIGRREVVLVGLEVELKRGRAISGNGRARPCRPRGRSRRPRAAGPARARSRGGSHGRRA